MRDANSLKHAQNMRKSMPEPEARMWNELRATRFRAIKFRRQKIIGKFIADFAANEPKLVIELDGDTHAGSENYDVMRTRYLEEQGYEEYMIELGGEVRSNSFQQVFSKFKLFRRVFYLEL